MLEHVRTCWNTFPGGEFSTSKNLVEYGGDISLSKSKSSLPLLPLPLLPHPPFPLSFFGGGRGGGGGDGGEPLHRPPEGGGTKSPPLLPQDFKDFFTQGRLIWNIFLFSLSLYSLCVIYPRGRSSVHSSKLQKLMLSSQQNSLWHTSMKFKNRLIFLSLNISSLCVIYHWRIIYFE
jgi:hypothetical protein